MPRYFTDKKKKIPERSAMANAFGRAFLTPARV